MVELIKEDNKEKWFIRKGFFKNHCVVDDLTKKDLLDLAKLIVKELKKYGKNK
jgi:hypothetical protein